MRSRMPERRKSSVARCMIAALSGGMRLTEAGADFPAGVEPILAALEEADHAARGTGELRGVLRVGLSSSLAVREVIPRLSALTSRHPALRVELLMNDQRQDLVIEGVDVALRFGMLGDSNATARPAGARAASARRLARLSRARRYARNARRSRQSFSDPGARRHRL